VIAIVQLAAMVGVFVLVFLAERSGQRWAYVTAAAVAVTELIQIGISRQAIRQARPASFDGLYASRPLPESQRQLVLFNLVLQLTAPVWLVLTVRPASFARPVAALLLYVAVFPGLASLERVRQHNSWLAVSRLPAAPRGKGT
jgi:hypothetical protein